MAQTIIDLDALVPQDKKATLGGVVYTVPGDLPMVVFLKMQRAAQLESEGVDSTELASVMKDALFSLFTYNLSDSDNVKRDALSKTLDSLGIRTYMQLFSALYSDEELADGDDGEDPTQPSPEVQDGTTSTNQNQTAE